MGIPERRKKLRIGDAVARINGLLRVSVTEKQAKECLQSLERIRDDEDLDARARSAAAIAILNYQVHGAEIGLKTLAREDALERAEAEAEQQEGGKSFTLVIEEAKPTEGTSTPRGGGEGPPEPTPEADGGDPQ